MSAFSHTLLLVATVIAAYVWLQIPGLQHYSLQAFALMAVLFIGAKRLSKAKPWHVLPTTLTFEGVFVTFGFLLLIGSTGNTESVFYPLTYVHLFFIIFSRELSTSIVMTMLIMLFHYSLSPALNNHAIAQLCTLPLIMIFFLFAKRQHAELTRDLVIIRKEQREMDNLTMQDSQLRMFLHTFLVPKLDQFEKLLEYPAENRRALLGQLQLVKLEIEKLLKVFRGEHLAATSIPTASTPETTTQTTDNITVIETTQTIAIQDIPSDEQPSSSF